MRPCVCDLLAAVHESLSSMSPKQEDSGLSRPVASAVKGAALMRACACHVMPRFPLHRSSVALDRSQ